MIKSYRVFLPKYVSGPCTLFVGACIISLIDISIVARILSIVYSVLGLSLVIMCIRLDNDTISRILHVVMVGFGCIACFMTYRFSLLDTLTAAVWMMLSAAFLFLPLRTAYFFIRNLKKSFHTRSNSRGIKTRV